MKKIVTAIMAFGFISLANANGTANTNAGSNGMPSKPCYVKGEMLGTLMDYYQCKAQDGSHNK